MQFALHALLEDEVVERGLRLGTRRDISETDSAGGDAREKSGEIFLLLGAEILSVGECGAHDSVNIALVALLALEPLDVGLRLVAGFSACRPDDGVQRSVHVLRHARGVAAHVKVRAGFEP